MSLCRLVVDAAARTPQAPAVCDHVATLTYAELDMLADRYAAALLARHVRPGDRVLVWTGKTVEAVAVAQAVLRIGAVHVPLGTANPVGRVARVIEDCGPALVVTDQDSVAGARRVTLSGLSGEAGEARARKPVAHHRTGSGDPAYILYTSGSTGRPKGICLSHGNALAFVSWACGEVGLRSDDRVANHAPFGFDLSVFDLYATFRAGASVYLIDETLARAPTQLAEFIIERAISVWYSVPSAMILMSELGGLLDHVLPALRICVFAGEPFPLSLLQRLRKAWPQVRMFNWYGPTETNVCTSYEVTAADLDRTTPIPIGRPASGDELWLDDGEIVVSGPTVMLGYWGREPQTGPYRTGDLGRYDAEGNLEYIGRADDLVKVCGHRVEPGEVEAALAAHETIHRAVAIVVGDGTAARIHGVVVAEPGQSPNLLDLRQHCLARLPPYMVPDALHIMEALPYNSNGKIDRAELRTALRQGVTR